MPIRPPALDDRSFDDLVADMVRRIPAHTPEWTNPRDGDPGRTLIDLFAWLGDTILYRANLIPERQRLTFLRLLGSGLRPAVPARGLIALSIDDPSAVASFLVPAFSSVDKPVPFETMSDVMVLAVEARAYIKRKPTDPEAATLADLMPDLRDLYGISGQPSGYVTTPVFADGAAEPAGRDIAGGTVDGCLWIALLAGSPAASQLDALRTELGGGADGTRRMLNVGIAPSLSGPVSFDDVGISARVPMVFEVNTGAGQGDTYLPLRMTADGTAGLTRAGVIRLELPGKENLGAPTNDVLKQVQAGVGDRPPRIDDAAVAARIVTWIRLRPDPASRGAVLPALAWAGVNAVAIEQRRSFGRQVIGSGSGASDQEFGLGVTSVDPVTLAIEVEEEEGMRPWRQVPDTMTASRDDRVYSLDAEAGTIRFGDGVRGMVPAAGRAIQVAAIRGGGGAAGNLPAGAISAISVPAGGPRLKVAQPLPSVGGADAETLPEAEARIPATIQNGGRAVTSADYQELAMRTPGLRLGRVEVLPQFKPQQRETDVPGVVSVMVLPNKAGVAAPAPRADRSTLESVYAWLDERRPLATELYVVGCDYVPIGIAAAVEVVDSNQRDSVLAAVETAIRLHLWALPPGGPDGSGWPLGRTIDDRMIEVAISRVPGVRSVAPVHLFFQRPGETLWRMVPADPTGRVTIPLLSWQLPELAMLAVSESADAATSLPAVPPAAGGVAVPVVPETC
jgi:predicted phage baseplate assembly protein